MSLKHNAKLRACGIESCKGALRLHQKNLHLLSVACAALLPSGSIFFHSPCIFLSGPVVRIMFKYIFRLSIGGWWLLVGVAPVRWAKFSFHVGPPRRFRGELFLIRIFRYEVSISELPF